MDCHWMQEVLGQRTWASYCSKQLWIQRDCSSRHSHVDTNNPACLWNSEVLMSPHRAVECIFSAITTILVQASHQQWKFENHILNKHWLSAMATFEGFTTKRLLSTWVWTGNSVFSVSERHLLYPCPASERRQIHLGQLEDLGMLPFHLSTVVFGMSNQLPVVGVGFSYRRAVRKTMKTCTYTQKAANNKSLLPPANKKPLLNPDKALVLTFYPQACREAKPFPERILLIQLQPGSLPFSQQCSFCPRPTLGPILPLKKKKKKSGCSRCISHWKYMHNQPTTTDELVGNKGHFLTKLLLQQRTAMTSK